MIYGLCGVALVFYFIYLFLSAREREREIKSSKEQYILSSQCAVQLSLRAANTFFFPSTSTERQFSNL